MVEYQNLQTERANNVLTIRLNRPKVNALNLKMVEELLDVFERIQEDDVTRCVVLTGVGGFFSTGHDVREIADVVDGVSYRAHLEHSYNRVVKTMHKIPKPIIGAINGPTAGAGLGIALATDVRWAAKRARFLYGFTGIGLTADSGVSLMLPIMMGYSKALEIAFTNHPITAEEALDCGLVSRVLEDHDLEEAVASFAASLAEGPTRALGLTKRAFHRSMLKFLDEVLDYEGYLQEIAAKTDDHREGLEAFLEKRPATFRGS
ncbi:MAG: 2-(1,2-epoxy-1,2-dihydrophenyl)acetyl-CoA isomerase [Anaerolineales bacterium]|nr:2-(1,2-epoxy-1,2-dihydrophenyl)acetyl-CoA isomerase [Anaerolineales bacterium]